jgi:hypothetical protein
MSLDVDLLVTKPVSIYSGNITHNLTTMARQVPVSPTLSLYDILWRADEHQLTHAKDIVNYLDIGWNILLSKPEYYKQYNPENGWGTYESLERFVYNYRNACWDNPDAEISICR